MNNIKFLIAMVRANPGYATIAVAIDLSVGAIAAATVYVLLNSTNVNSNTQAVLVFSAILAAVGMWGVGYTLLKSRLGLQITGTRDLSDIDLDDEIDENY